MSETMTRYESDDSPLFHRPGLFQSSLRPEWLVPTDEQCLTWWDRYDMPEHIRAHSLVVARVAGQLAELARAAGLDVCVQSVRASALLHDLAKHYCILHGGSHSLIGGAWAMELTGNPVLAMGVTHHIYWPFEINVSRYFMPLAVLYGDKRAKHENLVSLRERFEDLLVRYGHTPEIQEKIRWTVEQALLIEERMSTLLGEDLDAYPFDSGRLVG